MRSELDRPSATARAVEPAFTFGIEEEYHLANLDDGGLAAAPEPLKQAWSAALGPSVSLEFLQSQIEVSTRVHTSFAEARRELAHLRRTIAEIAAPYGIAPAAAGTYPLAKRNSTQPTENDRYVALATDLAGVGRRMLVSGMHVHVGIADNEVRIDLMNQARYFVPHLLALTTSSPFWETEPTGLKSFRSVIIDGLPRTGLPNRFTSWSEYEATVGVLIKTGVIDDASKVWWDLRPSGKHPTLELRALDVCTELDDAVAVAAIFVCLCRYLYRLRQLNQSWRDYPVFLIKENRWRAQRYGVSGKLFDFGKGTLEPVGDLIGEILALIGPEADAIGCRAEVAHACTIVARGTSADTQERLYAERLAAGDPQDVALRAVADRVVSATANV
ncbi:MAG: carboxylate-amine ligase [Hyphomicrobiaceae bacterium]